MDYRPNHIIRKLLIGASVIAMAGTANLSYAQDAEDDEVVVTGIRQSLKASMDLKRDTVGVLDAITAEDIGKFPDTNLAESMQRITGVSIDRSLGEGQSVTVRGFGADFNLVTLNGRAMPTSTLGDGASPPSSRSYDFGNIASENISGVDVYKTSRANVASGGIGATIDIRTTRPLDAAERVASIGVKGVYDTSSIQDEEITPEISGLFSRKFADGRLGVSLSGSYQHRKGGVSEYVGYDSGWHPSFQFNEAFQNEWGALPVSENMWNYWNHQYGTDPDNLGFADHPDAPDADAVYEIPQKGHYGATEFDRKRINGQLVLQYDLTDNVRVTGDYTYSENKVEAQRNTGGVWFNYNNTISAWTDGPVAGPLFFTDPTQSDLSFEGGYTANKNVNNSLGFNVSWDVNENLTLEADFHDSSAESSPDSKYGSNVVIGTAVVGVTSQTINFENDLPVISIQTNPDMDPFDPNNRYATGSVFRNAYMRDDIQQFQLNGSYGQGDGQDFSLIDSVDFGVSIHKNKVRTAFGVLQNNNWGGLGTAADYNADLFTPVSISELLDGADGVDDPNILREIQIFNAAALAEDMEARFNICSNPEIGTPIGQDSCLAEYTTDRRLQEDTFSGYFQYNNAFELFGQEANLVMGARYEKTDVDSSALVPTWNGTAWTGDNEFNLIPSGEAEFTTVSGSYDKLLPNVYFDFQPAEFVKLRAAYSHTLTRPTYDRLQGGLELGGQFGASRGGGGQGNPALAPNLSKNIDVSAEWYYGDDSYISVGYYNKNVSDFIGSGEYQTRVEGIHHPLYGPRADEARAELGQNATLGEIRSYIIANFPDTLDANGNPMGMPEDELVEFTIGIPVANDFTLGMDGWEFSIQHMFWDSGFGAIVNYTIANGDFEFDNALVGLPGERANQFALPGLSDSANLIGFYDKNGLQARVAWNWRDAFLASASGTEPWYTEAYSQLDANVSYEIRDGLTLFVEGIDLTGSDRRGHHRHKNAATFYNAQQPRYAFGARYKF